MLTWASVTGKSKWFHHVHLFVCYRPLGCYLMALPADVLAKVLAFVPADLQMTSSLRVASKYAKERVDTRWWTAQVQDMKAFMDGHACLFAADPVSVEGNEDVSIEEQQEAFARNILLWVKPLLVNQPWSSEVHDHEVHHDDDDDATGEITPRAAHINLRRAMTNLSHSELLLDCFLFACVSHKAWRRWDTFLASP